MCRRPQAGRCSPPHRAAAGCRSSAAAENAYFLTKYGFESVGNIPTFSSGISCKKIFTTFCHQKEAPKVSAGYLRRDRTEVLPERARKIYAVYAHPLRALEPPSDLFLPPVQCGGCCALRATMIIRLRPYMAGPRPARSHCFRYFSRCLIFWCFWIKPKAQEKLRKGRTSRLILREESRVFDGASAARSPFPIFRKAERWALCAAIVCVISRTCNLHP